MTKEEAVKEERARYLNAIYKKALRKAHIHLLALHRLTGAYTNWDSHTGRSV